MRSDPKGLTPFSTRALWVALLATLAGFVALALAYEHEPLATVDREVAEWVAATMPTWGEWLARPPSWLGGWIGITAIGIVLGVVLLRERAWLDLGFLLTTFAGSAIAVTLLKAWFDRPRPDLGSAVALPSSAAFPSGHATAGAASLGAAVVLVTERLDSPRTRAWVWGVAIAGGLAVGLSRIVLNVHYVTDVLAGWCLGLAWLAACLLLRDRLRREMW
ncbi:MAG TPA: phosphatase PAP2 family protein [Gaiellaceae bacterium]|nr:phosphatase PAP2 family protein [Gaiellaceae bacterium]